MIYTYTLPLVPKTQHLKLLFFLIVSFVLLPQPIHAQKTAETEAHRRQAAQKLARLCPLGDYTYVYVYDFITNELRSTKTKRADALKVTQQEKKNELSGEIYKPYIASVHETSLSHVLSALCKADEKCVAVSLFDQAGFIYAIGLAKSSVWPNVSEKLIIEDVVFNAYKEGKLKLPFLNRLSETITGFTWNPFAKLLSSLTPFFSMRNMIQQFFTIPITQISLLGSLC